MITIKLCNCISYILIKKSERFYLHGCTATSEEIQKFGGKLYDELKKANPKKMVMLECVSRENLKDLEYWYEDLFTAFLQEEKGEWLFKIKPDKSVKHLHNLCANDDFETINLAYKILDEMFDKKKSNKSQKKTKTQNEQ